MGKQKKKYYVVWEGHKPGVYDSWSACQSQVTGYPGAKYKSFKSRDAADAAFRESFLSHVGQKKASAGSMSKTITWDDVVLPSFCVDAACSGNPGKMEYRGVWTSDGTELFRVGPMEDGTNNIGEFLALVHALAFFKKANKQDLPIYSDSKIALGWVRKKKCNTKLKRTSRNTPIFDLIQRAENWLSKNSFSNPLLKWETSEWGEIPADFGRK